MIVSHGNFGVSPMGIEVGEAHAQALAVFIYVVILHLMCWALSWALERGSSRADPEREALLQQIRDTNTPAQFVQHAKLKRRLAEMDKVKKASSPPPSVLRSQGPRLLLTAGYIILGLSFRNIRVLVPRGSMLTCLRSAPMCELSITSWLVVCFLVVSRVSHLLGNKK